MHPGARLLKQTPDIRNDMVRVGTTSTGTLSDSARG